MKLFYLLILLTSISLAKKCWIRVWDLDGSFTPDEGGYVDPYVQVCVKDYGDASWDCSCHTDTDWNSDSPEWEKPDPDDSEEIRYGMCEVDEHDQVKMILWDKDPLGTDDKLGESEHDIETIYWTRCRDDCHDSGESDWSSIIENDLVMESSDDGSNMNLDYKYCCEEC